MTLRDHSFGMTGDERMAHIIVDHAPDLDKMVVQSWGGTRENQDRRARAWHQKIHGTPKNTPAARRAAAQRREMGVTD